MADSFSSIYIYIICIYSHVSSQIERLKARHEKYQDLIRTTNTSVNTEFKELRKTLVKDIRGVDKDLRGLREAVDMVEKNRAKFAHIKDGELASRKKFVDDAAAALLVVKNGINSQEVLRKIEEDERNSKRESYDEKSALSGQAYEENSRFIRGQKQQTIELINQQDQNLDKLGQAVDRVGVMAKEINTEVKEQGVMLDGLERDIDDSSSRLAVVQEALGKLLKTKDGCQIWTIVILTLVLSHWLFGLDTVVFAQSRYFVWYLYR
eukprot:scaffold369_cov177-Ochromonas_danica.AAC.28